MSGVRSSQWQAFVEATPIGIVTLDPAGAIAFNSRAAEILGMALVPEAGVAQYAGRLRYIDGTPLALAALPSVRALRDRTRIAAEAYQVVRDDGAAIIVIASAAPIFDAEQAVIGSMVVLEDVSARIGRDTLIADSIVALAADAIIAVDATHRIVLFNAGAEAAFGWSVAEVLGQPLDVLIPERFRGAHAGHLAAFAQAAPNSRRMAHTRKAVAGLRRDGREFPIDASIARLDVAGRPLLAVVLRDISEERRRAADREFLGEASSLLVASLEYEQTLATVAQLAVPTFADACVVNIVGGDGDARTVRRIKVAHVDPALAARLSAVEAWPAREVSHLPVWRELLAGRTVLYSDLAAGPLPIPVESEEHAALLQALGATSLLVVPLVARGRVVGAISFIASTSGRRYDRGDLELAEELARRAALAVDNAQLYAAAQQAIRARDHVLAVVAHDLRNPVNAIALNARAAASAERRAGLEVPATARIAESAQRANRLIGDLLDVAKIEAGNFAVAPAPSGPQALVAEAVHDLRPFADEAGIALVADCEEAAPSVLADRDRVAQVFANLVGNALKFTPAGGTVRVGARALADGRVRFSVADTGPGLTAEQLARVFDRFWQGHPADQRGAGLGLAIARGIVEAHGGAITVASEVGIGTTFAFTLPAAPG